MTPSNPDNQQPLIYRIADALGVFHLVAPVNHTHSQSEIQGLEAALSVKQDALTFDTTPTEGSTNPVTSGGVKEAIDNHIVSTVTRDDFESGKYAQVFVLANGGVGVQTSTGFGVALQINGNTKWFMVDPDTIDNLIRASQSPDSTPTANSNNLVTSGGVAAALATKANKDDVEFKVFEKNAASDKINLSTDFAQGQKRATYVISNYTSDACALSDLFTYQSGEIGTAIVLPATEQPAIQVDGAVVVSVLKYSDDSAINYIIVPESYY